MLARYTNEGIELVIDNETGEAFATQAGYARMGGKDRTTIVRRCQKVSAKERLKEAQIDTGYGLKVCVLIPAQTVFEWLLDDNKELAMKMGAAGATQYLYQLAGYKVGLIDRPQAEHHLPQTYLEALKALVAAEEEKQRLELENAELLAETIRMAEVIDELFDYSSILRVAKFNQCDEKRFNWRSLKKASTQLGLEIKKVPCPRYKEKNLYHHEAWMLAYPDIKLPEVSSLTIAPKE